MITSRYFIKYMNEALNVYKNDKQVCSIHGYSYPNNLKKKNKLLFYKGSDCWGWATWSRAWKYYQKNANILLRRLKNRGLVNEFNFSGSYNYLEMLENSANKKIIHGQSNGMLQLF